MGGIASEGVVEGCCAVLMSHTDVGGSDLSQMRTWWIQQMIDNRAIGKFWVGCAEREITDVVLIVWKKGRKDILAEHASVYSALEWTWETRLVGETHCTSEKSTARD